MEPKPVSTLFYGMVGVAAVGVLSFLTLAIILFSTPAGRFDLTSVASPPELSQPAN